MFDGVPPDCNDMLGFWEYAKRVQDKSKTPNQTMFIILDCKKIYIYNYIGSLKYYECDFIPMKRKL